VREEPILISHRGTGARAVTARVRHEKSLLESKDARLEIENRKLKRLMLDHNTQSELKLKRFQQLPTGS
jgi:hypothetical protein